MLPANAPKGSTGGQSYVDLFAASHFAYWLSKEWHHSIFTALTMNCIARAT